MYTRYRFSRMKYILMLSALLMQLLVFAYFSDEAKGEEISLVVSVRHQQVGEILKKYLSPIVQIKLVVVPLDELTRIVLANETDFFVISISEIFYTKMSKGINLAEKGQAVGSADIAEKVHLTTLVKTEIKEIADIDDKLPEKPVSLGPKNSSTEAHANCSIDAQRKVKGPPDFRCGSSIKCKNDDFDKQDDKLINEEIKAYLYVSGEVPVPSVENVANKSQLRLAHIPEKIVDEMKKCSINDKFVKTTINMNDYKSGDEIISTAGIPAPVAATDKTNNKIVLAITKALVEENPFISKEILPDALKAIHSFMKFHPTSLMIFKEFGLKTDELL